TIRLVAGFPSEGRRELHRRFAASCRDEDCAGTGSCAAGACTSAIDPSLTVDAAAAARALAACALDDADGGVDGGPRLDAEAPRDAGADGGCGPCDDVFVSTTGTDHPDACVD